MQTDSSPTFAGPIVSLILLAASAMPEIPPFVQWLCLLLSMTASILAIIKNAKK